MGVSQAGVRSQREVVKRSRGSGARRIVRGSRVGNQEQAAQSQQSIDERPKQGTAAAALVYIYAEHPAPPSGKEEPQGVVSYKNPRKQDGCQHMSVIRSLQGGKTMTGGKSVPLYCIFFQLACTV